MTVDLIKHIDKLIIGLASANERLEAQAKTNANAYADLDRRLKQVEKDLSNLGIAKERDGLPSTEAKLAHLLEMQDYVRFENFDKFKDIVDKRLAVLIGELSDHTHYIQRIAEECDLTIVEREVYRNGERDGIGIADEPLRKDEVDMDLWIEWAEEHKDDPLLQEFIKRSIRFDPI